MRSRMDKKKCIYKTETERRGRQGSRKKPFSCSSHLLVVEERTDTPLLLEVRRSLLWRVRTRGRETPRVKSGGGAPPRRWHLRELRSDIHSMVMCCTSRPRGRRPHKKGGGFADRRFFFRFKDREEVRVRLGGRLMWGAPSLGDTRQ